MKHWWMFMLAYGVIVVPAFAGDVTQFMFPLEGAQVVPPSGSPATGACTITLDQGALTIDVDCTYQGLLGDATLAHIHGPALPGQNAGVQVPLTPSGGTSGTINDIGLPVTAQQAQDMLDGLHYVNLHTVAFPGGEIRGQVVGAGLPVPAVGAWWSGVALLLVLGVGALILGRRRRPAAA